MRLNLGCGADIRPGWVNVDKARLPGVDVVHDLDQVPWPLDDEAAGQVEAVDIFEHVADPIAFMGELWRVLAADAPARICTTHWQHENAWTDPTHRRTATERTFDYWVPGTELHDRYGAAYASGCCFAKDRARPDDAGGLEFVLRKLPA